MKKEELERLETLERKVRELEESQAKNIEDALYFERKTTEKFNHLFEMIVELEEAKKCDILCCNCHSKLHWGSEGN